MSNLAPFLKVFNNQGSELNFTKITRFTFTHSEEADDFSSIEIQTLDTSLPDNKDFNEGSKLTILFGYIGGLKSKKYTLFLIDIEPHFGPDGIIIKLKLGDKAQYAKQTSKKTLRTGEPPKLLEDIAKENGLNFKGIEYNGSLIRGTEPVYRKTDSFVTTQIDNTAVPILRKVEIPQANKSDIGVIHDIMETQPGGGWVITGHEEELIVKNRNFTQAPMRVYTYKGEDGHLLDFSPKTQNKAKKKKATNLNIGSWDSLKKEYYQGNINQGHSNNTVLNQTVEYPNVGSIDDDNQDWQKKVLDSYKFGTKEVGENTQGEKYIANQKTQIKGSDDTSLNEDIWTKNPEDNPSNNSSNLLGKQPEAEELKDLGNGKKWKYIKIDRSTPTNFKLDSFNAVQVDATNVISEGYEAVDIKQNQETVSEDSKEENATKALNQREEALLYKNSAEAIVLGNPLLESGKVIAIVNVSKKYSGKWYISSVKHEIDFPGGYLSHCELITNSLGKTGQENASVLDARTLGLQVNDSELSTKNINTKTLGR